MFGQEVPIISGLSTRLLTYIYNTQTEKWTNVTQNFPCQKLASLLYKYTCAYMRPLKSVILSVDECIPILNLTAFPTSWIWSSINAPMDTGIVFNTNDDENNVIFIGNDGGNQSEIHMVCFYSNII